MAQAGYLTTVKKSGTPTAMTAEACTTNSTVANTYRISDATKRVWDRTTVLTALDDGTTVASTQYTVDFLFGSVTFTSTQDEPVTVTGTYMPMTNVAGANSYTLSASRELVDDTDFSSTGWRSKAVAIKDVSLSITRWADVDADFWELINDVNAVSMVEIKPGSGTLAARGFFMVSSDARSGDVATLETADVTFELDSSTAASFGWGEI
jgi:hypothetical protein